MKTSQLTFTRCPGCHGTLVADESFGAGEEIERGTLVCETCHRLFDIVGGIPRFVPRNNYSTNFGFQWKKFRKTQLDSCSGLPISETRFYAQSQWKAEDLKGKLVLDVGCGAGRFTEIALAAGANVVAIDYSDAVEACYANHGSNPHLSVMQADIYRLPFRPETFD